MHPLGCLVSGTPDPLDKDHVFSTALHSNHILSLMQHSVLKRVFSESCGGLERGHPEIIM
jgi:hypothetical protein